MSRIEIRETVEPERLSQLIELHADTWWAAERREQDVAAMLRHRP